MAVPGNQATAIPLEDAGYLVAEMRGHSREGDLAILHVEIPRKLARNLVRHAAALDPTGFCVINDVRVAKYLTGSMQNAAPTSVSTFPTDRLARLKR